MILRFIFPERPVFAFVLLIFCTYIWYPGIVASALFWTIFVLNDLLVLSWQQHLHLLDAILVGHSHLYNLQRGDVPLTSFWWSIQLYYPVTGATASQQASSPPLFRFLFSAMITNKTSVESVQLGKTFDWVFGFPSKVENSELSSVLKIAW